MAQILDIQQQESFPYSNAESNDYNSSKVMANYNLSFVGYTSHTANYLYSMIDAFCLEFDLHNSSCHYYYCFD